MKVKLVFFILLVSMFSVWYYQKRQENHAATGELTLYGNVDIRQVDLGFRVYGKVTHLYVDEGDEVVPGTLLAKLDPGPYLCEYYQGKAKVASLTAAVESAELKFLRRDDTDTLAVSEEDYEDALFSTEQLYADLEQANSALALSKIHVHDTKLFAPSTGTILTRIREKGSVLNPGEPVFTLSLKSPVWIRAYVSETNLGKIYPGMKARVITDANPKAHIEGQVGFISPTAEFTPKTVESAELRTDLVYRIRVIVAHPEKTLKQGMPVTVHLMGL